MMIRERNYKIVNLRAIAILTVVLGHSIILYSPSWGLVETDVECTFLKVLKDFINCYQMQLYFFLSGFLMYQSMKKKQCFRSFIQNKVQRLVIPYFVFGLFWMYPIKKMLHLSSFEGLSFMQFLIQIVEGNNTGHLWFLYTLFLIFVVSYIPNKFLGTVEGVNKYYIVGGVILLISSILSFFVTKHICFTHFQMQNVLVYAFWFQLGFYMHEGNRITNMLMIGLCTAIILLTSPMMMISLCIVLGLYHFMPNKEWGILSFLDKYSFGIYLFHSPLIYITYTILPNAHPCIVVFLNFVVMGVVSILLTHITKKIKWLHI